MDCFNTNKEAGKNLIRSIKKARSQQEIILGFLVAHPYQSFTPDEIRGILFGVETPITSIRRAMTNLANAGYIVKNESVDDMRMGEYNKLTHTWVYIPEKQIVRQGNLF